MFDDVEYLDNLDMLVLIWAALRLLVQDVVATPHDEARIEEVEELFDLLNAPLQQAA